MHIDGCLTPNDLLKSSELVGGVWLEALNQDSSEDDSGGHWYIVLFESQVSEGSVVRGVECCPE